MADVVIAVVKSGVLIFAFATAAAYLIYGERKVVSYLQVRMGPNRAGPFGLLQSLADIIKLMFKEELRPKAADRVLFALAPVISATAAFTAFSVVPFGAETTIFGLLDHPVPLQVADVNVAVLVVRMSSARSA